MNRRRPSARRARPVLLTALLSLALAPGAARALTVEEISLGAPPSGVAAGPDGKVYVTTSAPSVVELTPGGGIIANHPLPAGHGGSGPTFSGGALWWLGATALERRSPDGTVARISLPTPGATASSLTPGDGGSVWFAESGAKNAVAHVRPDGTATEFPVASGTPLSMSADATGELWLNVGLDYGYAPPRVSQAGVIAPVDIAAHAWKVVASPSISTVWFAAADGLCCYTPQSQVDYAYWLTPGTSGGAVVGGFLADMRVRDIAVGPDANAWVRDADNVHIGRLATSGRMTLFPTNLPATATIGQLVAGPAATMWFVDAGTGRLGRIALDQPATTTEAASAVGETFAMVGAVAVARGAASRVRFEYGTTTGYGTATRWQDIGDSDDGVGRTARLQGLAPGTTYHYRAVVDSPLGANPGPDRTLATTPLPPAPPPPPTDVDGDGYAAAVDCDDDAASVYPGAPEIAGDGRDQDCDGADQALPRFFPHVVAYFKNRRGRWSRFTSLLINDVPAGARVRLACAGHGCRFKRWSTRVARAPSELDLLPRLAGSRLGPKAMLELQLTLSGHVGTVVRWKVGPPPVATVTCLTPAARKDTRC